MGTYLGAVAIDSSTGDIGTVVGQRSKSIAKQEAMKRCTISGSKNCAFRLAYRNQCVVVAWPNGVGGHVLTQSAPSIEVATSLAPPRNVRRRPTWNAGSRTPNVQIRYWFTDA